MPVRNPAIRPLSDFEADHTLGEDLVDVADDLRQLYSEFGLRPLRVFLVWVRFTADENADGLIDDGEDLIDDGTVGAGRPVLLAEIELLPTPRVGPLGGVRQSLEAVGRTEVGAVTVDQISSSFSEDVLQGLLPEFADPARPNQLLPGIQFFYEVQENRPAGHSNPFTEGGVRPTSRRSPRRKFVLDSTPARSPDAFQWSVDLVRSDGERGRNGEVLEVLP